MVWPLIPLTQEGVSQGINSESVFFLHAALTGVFLVAVYDVLRIFRRVCPHGTFWVAVEDFFYWIFTGLVIFFVLLEENNGIIRWFFVFGMGTGMLLYHFSVSRFIVSFIAFALKKALNIVRKMMKIILTPLLKVAKFWGRYIKKIIKSTKDKLEERKKTIEKNQKKTYNQSANEKQKKKLKTTQNGRSRKNEQRKSPKKKKEK